MDRSDGRKSLSPRLVGACAILLAMAMHARAQDNALPAFKAVDTMEARVQGCVTCHGQSGEGTGNGYFPRIAGKPAGYLYNQLVAFRDGTRHYAPMNYLVAYLPDAYLREIAEHFAKQRPAFAPRQVAHVDAATLARTRRRSRAAARWSPPAIRRNRFPRVSHAMAQRSRAWSPECRGWWACGRPTSRRSSRAGAWVSAARPSPTA
jgi:cytochrome c553